MRHLDDQLATGQPLADIVVALTGELDGHTMCQPGAKRLPRRPIGVDLDRLDLENNGTLINNYWIRERKNSGAIFKASGSKPMLSSITFGVGSGRGKKERKISLTSNQGKFLYFLPFPNAEFKSVGSIMKEADVDSSYKEEIADMISILKINNIIEMKEN